MGVCEKIPNTTGTMFNTQIYFGPDGGIIRKHQKIMPTVGERLVHMGGYGDTFGAFQSEFGPMSGLICGENSNPLAVFALIAEGTRIHVMSWPNHFPTSGDPLRNRVAIDSQAFAQMSKAFVISACGTVDERMIEMLQAGPEAEKFLRDPNCCGGSLIVDPLSRIIAGPMGAGGRHPLRRMQSRPRHPDEAPSRLRRPLQPAGHFPAAHQSRRAAALSRAQRSGGARGADNRSACPPRRARLAAPDRRRMNDPSQTGDTMDVFEAVDSPHRLPRVPRQAGRSRTSSRI